VTDCWLIQSAASTDVVNKVDYYEKIIMNCGKVRPQKEATVTFIKVLYCPDIRFEGMTKTKKNSRQNSPLVR
jgi:hypothetical protein